MLAATKVLSRQNYVCRDKHAFVSTKNKTKQKLVAAPANGREGRGREKNCCRCMDLAKMARLSLIFLSLPDMTFAID